MDSKPVINYISFNQDQKCFAIGTQTGFTIYNSYPFKGAVKRGKKCSFRFGMLHWNR